MNFDAPGRTFEEELFTALWYESHKKVEIRENGETVSGLYEIRAATCCSRYLL